MEKLKKIARAMLNDYSYSNYTLKKEAFTDSEIENALHFSLKQLNQYPPVVTTYDYTTAPVYLVSLGAVLWLLKQMSMVESAIPQFSTDSNTYPGKFEALQSIIQMLESKHNLLLTNFKHIINVNSGFGNDPYKWSSLIWWW